MLARCKVKLKINKLKISIWNGERKITEAITPGDGELFFGQLKYCNFCGGEMRPILLMGRVLRWVCNSCFPLRNYMWRG